MLIINSQSSCFISDGESRTSSSKCHRPILGRTEEAVQGGCLWSESTFFLTLIQLLERWNVNFQRIGKIHMDLNVFCLPYYFYEIYSTLWKAVGREEMTSCFDVRDYPAEV